MRFLTHRFVIILACVGFGVSLGLGFLSGVHAFTVIVRACLSAVGMGGFGFLFLFVLEKVLPTNDFEELMALLEGKTSPSGEIPQKNGEEAFSSEGERITGAAVNVVEDSNDWASFVEEKNMDSGEGMPPEEEVFSSPRVFDPAAAVMADSSSEEDFKDFSSQANSSSSSEYQELKTNYEKERPTFSDNKVSFTVNSKKVNTSPEVVAKAIKTILSRDS